jgi:hypothetical protein
MRTKHEPVSPPPAVGCGADFSLAVAACRVALSLPDAEARRELSALWSSMEPERAGDAEVSISWHGLVCTAEPGPRVVETHSPAYIPALTHILMLERLCAHVPDLVVVHGNALYDARDDRAILLLGHSGSGKSTLSRQLLISPHFSLLAEDTLLIRLNGGILHPYPRAASLRIPRGTATDEPRWRGLGRGNQDKILVAPQRVHRTPVTVRHAIVFSLSTADHQTTPSGAAHVPDEETFWLSHADAGLASRIQGGYPGAIVHLRSSGDVDFPSVVIPQRLHGQPRMAFLALLAEHRAMVLASRVGPPTPTRIARRGVSPTLTRLGPIDGLQAVIDHETRFPAPDIPERDPVRNLMQLGGAFSRARFHHLIPGGSVEDTAKAMIQVLEDGRA